MALFEKKMSSLLLSALLVALLFGCGGASGPTYTTTASSPNGALKSISITPANSSLAATTGRQFTAIGTYANNRTVDITDMASWMSSRTNIATVSNSLDARGFASALSTAGTTTISASLGGRTGSTGLTVTTATIASITVTPTNPSIPNGASQQFTATGAFSDGSTQNITASATWSSANLNVATIGNAGGAKGHANAVGAGSSSITASFGGMSDSTNLTVTPPVLVSIELTPENPTVLNGLTQQFTATGTFDNNTTQNLTAGATWVSSNTNVATVNASGLASMVSSGETTITVSSGLVSKNTTLTVISSGTTILTWDAPTQYASGEALDHAADLRAYNVYYRTASQSYSQTRMLTFTDHASTPVEQSVTLATGTYYFVVTAVTDDYLESDYSNEISRTIN